MRRLNSEENYTKKKAVRWLRLILVIFLGLFFLELWSVNRLSTYGDKIQELKQAQASLELENLTLENQIASDLSLLTIEEKAAKLGFSSVKNLEYIKPVSIASAL